MATGYFAVWLALGAGVYALGLAFAAAAMRWEMTSLLGCRSRFGCIVACPEHETDFRLGCKQGAACCLCCAAPTVVLVVLGMMNPLVIVGVAIVIAAEKLLPRPEIVARLVGISTIIAGVASLVFLRQ